MITSLGIAFSYALFERLVPEGGLVKDLLNSEFVTVPVLASMFSTTALGVYNNWKSFEKK